MQIERFFKSIDYIEKNIDNDISIHDVATAAHYSSFHYSRAFKAITGESVMDYIRKRRLTIAAKRLLETDIDILQLAIAAQFASQEAFTRAFKKMFGIAPGKYRHSGDPFRLKYCDQFSWSNLQHLDSVTDRVPRFETRNETRVVGLAKQFSISTPDYFMLWAPFKSYIGHIPFEIPNCNFGIYEAAEANGDEAQFSYMCCSGVTEFGDIPEGLQTRVLPEQHYAVFKHRGPFANVQETFKYIWGTWLPNSDFDYSPTPDLEVFPANYNSTAEDAVVDLYVPICEKPAA